MKLELREEAASGVSRSTARGTSEVAVLMGKVLGVSMSKLVAAELRLHS